MEGYRPEYSAVRLQQSEEYLVTAASEPFQRQSGGNDIELCVGVLSVAREGARYLRAAVASLVQGLTEEERNGIHLIVFMPQSNPALHPAYHEAWLANLTDELLLYNLTGADPERVSKLEASSDARRKIMMDYQYLMKACHDTGAPYMALLEDDIVAMHNWYHRTMEGLSMAEEIASQKEASKGFLYLRLFYTEEFLGWNVENLGKHIFWSIVLVIAVAILLIWSRAYSSTSQAFLSNRVVLFVCGVCVPCFIILFFAAGRMTTLPLPTGVNVMNNYGCCTQGLVWPRHKAEELMEWYDRSNPLGYGDILIEQYADSHDELRLAITPSVIQHIGVKSSKVGASSTKSKHERPMSEKLWNFRFELNNAEELKRELELAVADGG
ncbi:hypothetical protein LTR37_005649 [Vermiconidia calcicola]|uniref:Uncharacterized protein n=1 Tax=Vermiconidia calcicola TaxID=1690605 RepID=A0ACC3NIN9_9PEZI|nr:hypothetical protein LTR37_005649 [Vermiconidia calcicola]